MRGSFLASTIYIQTIFSLLFPPRPFKLQRKRHPSCIQAAGTFLVFSTSIYLMDVLPSKSCETSLSSTHRDGFLFSADEHELDGNVTSGHGATPRGTSTKQKSTVCGAVALILLFGWCRWTAAHIAAAISRCFEPLIAAFIVRSMRGVCVCFIPAHTRGASTYR